MVRMMYSGKHTDESRHYTANICRDAEEMGDGFSNNQFIGDFLLSNDDRAIFAAQSNACNVFGVDGLKSVLCLND